MAIALAEAGADVAVTSRSGEAATTVSRIEKLDRGAMAIAADFVDPDIADDVVSQAITRFEHIDILVNNARTISRSPALDTTREDWEHVVNVNLTAVWTMSQAAGRHMANSAPEAKS